MNRRRTALALLGAVPGLALTGCADLQRSAYYPDRLTAGIGGSYDRTQGHWDKIIPVVSVSWPLKPVPVEEAPPTPTHHHRGEGEAP